jgi:hypothetical protein
LSPQEKQILDRENEQIAGYSQRVRVAYAAMAAQLEAAGLEQIATLGDEPELLFADECHFGDVAADRIARRIAERLVELAVWREPASKGLHRSPLPAPQRAK